VVVAEAYEGIIHIRLPYKTRLMRTAVFVSKLIK